MVVACPLLIRSFFSYRHKLNSRLPAVNLLMAV
ncbi:hypothetical protein V6Z11_A05G215000 [Gossypium hirsutum]